MEIFMRNIPYTADDVTMTLQLQPILHGEIFQRYASSSGRLINFKVYLLPDKRYRRHPHSGCGILTVPSEAIGNTFLSHFGGYLHTHTVRVDDRDIRFERSKKPPRSDTLGEIQLLPYRDPRAIRETEQRLANLSGVVGLQDVQFTWLCRDGHVSIEWQWNLDDGSSDGGYWIEGTPGNSYSLRFNDATREVHVKKSTSIYEFTIAMRYSRIQVAETNGSSGPTILFLLETPPSFERGLLQSLPRFLLPSAPAPNTKRQKLTHLDDAHAPLAPFTWNALRLVCKSLSDLAEFKRMAGVANLSVQDHYRLAERRGLFSPSVLQRMRNWLRCQPWSVAFQCEVLHKTLLLDTVELLGLRSSIENIVVEHGPEHAKEVLRQFGLHLRELWYREDGQTVQSCFDQAKDEIEQSGTSRQPATLNSGLFECLHANFTPTGMSLRGPFIDTSNRIIRQYPGKHDCFLRVSFSDEDGLKFRFDRREVDGPEFIDRRVGTLLKDGFTLCGRRFEFLAYSQSALKQYTVWFVTPFEDSQGRTINAEHIRRHIGTTIPEDVRRCPARFAARISQAFTATESPMFIESDQVERIPDIERNGYCFSDGNGPLSQDMADAIHDALHRGGGRTNRGRRTPSVFQVRIQGAKGVLSVDSTLSGLRISLRPSMVKFESVNNRVDVEIARSFTKPGKFFLNRPLAMILEGLGVPVKVFLQLQQDAVEDTQEAAKSLKRAANLLQTHGLGTAFALPSTFLNLHRLGVEFEQDITSWGLHDAFMERCMQFAVHHVLRDMKFRARIPVPESWKLVGVVDNYGILEPDQIYACVVRGEGAKPEYLSGPILIFKSPTIHPGDVQIAEAIGAPPPDSPLNSLFNCVVFSQLGDRPLPNKLSGSDLDGDEYDLITFRPLHPPTTKPPGEYPAAPRLNLERDSTIKDVADFVVNFINNDMLGIVATNFLLIADLRGIFTPQCEDLARLHSWAVDFPKSGEPVPFDQIPSPDVSVKPDWHAPEIATTLDANYYPSQSVLGKLFRDIRLPTLSAASYDSRAQQRRRKKQESLSLEVTLQKLSLDTGSFDDQISVKLRRRLTPLVDLEHTEELTSAITNLFDHFAAELEHICFSYTLSRKATARLTEEEVFMGTIVAKSTQPRMRRDRISGMRDETTALVLRVWNELEGGENASIQDWINRAWTAWKISLLKKDMFGSRSFGWTALRAICEAIKSIEDD